MVAAQIDAMIPEEFLKLALTLVGTFQAGAWNDQWNPVALLQRAGFEVLLGATMVLAVADADDNLANFVVKYRQTAEKSMCPSSTTASPSYQL